MGDVEFKIDELEFNHDPEIIIAYKNTDRFYDRALEDFINWSTLAPTLRNGQHNKTPSPYP